MNKGAVAPIGARAYAMGAKGGLLFTDPDWRKKVGKLTGGVDVVLDGAPSISYALADSPVGQAAWIYEKFYAWTDNDGAPEDALSRHEILDAISLYWLTNSAASSGRLYWESANAFKAQRLEVPVGVSSFPKEIFRPSRRWAQRSYPKLIHWNELPKGGHFAAYEQPQLFVGEIRACFAKL